jgi:hypothetical protein
MSGANGTGRAAGRAVLAGLRGADGRPAPVGPPARPLTPHPPYRPFPTDALPPVLRAFVTEAASAVDCDPAFVALPLLAAVGAAAGNALVVRAKRRFRQPPLLWCLAVAHSGTGKTPGWEPSDDLAKELSDRAAEQHAADLRRYAADLAAWEAAPDPDPAYKPVRPRREYFRVADVTIQRLAEMLADSPRGLLLSRDELSGWFGDLTRYRGRGGGSDRPQWIEAFEAKRVSVHRKGGGQRGDPAPRDVEAERGFVAMCGGIQPEVLRAALADPGYVHSGMAARFCFAMPPYRVPRWTEAELSADAERAAARVLATLRELPFDPRSGPAEVGLAADARARFEAVFNELAGAAEARGGDAMSAALSKGVRLVLRLALVLHCAAEAAAGRDPAKAAVPLPTLRAGERLARWFLAEAERVYAMLAEPDADRADRPLCEFIGRKGVRLAGGGTSVTVRALVRSKRFPTSAAAAAALNGLAANGRGEWRETPSPRGGHPRREFVLHAGPTLDTRHSAGDVPPDDAGEPEQADHGDAWEG